MVVDEAGVLLGTVSDGDVRRGLLRGLTMETPIEEIVFTTPLAVPPTIRFAERYFLRKKHPSIQILKTHSCQL